MRLLRPLPRSLRRVLSLAALLAWVFTMALVAHRARATPLALAADLAQYGSSARWRGIYYRGDKIGFSVGRTEPRAEGYEIREDARLQMTILGSPTAVSLGSMAEVDTSFRLKRFRFSLDPGTGATEVSGTLDGRQLRLTVRTPSGERTETRELAEPPALSLNLPQALVARGLETGQVHEVSVFDPLTMANAPMRLEVQARELVRAAGRPIPAFRVESRFAGIITRTWITDVGEVVREESPTGLIVVRETQERAQAIAVSGELQADLLEAAAIVPETARRIDEPTMVRRLRVRISGAEGFDGEDLDGAGQSRYGDVLEIVDARELPSGPLQADLIRYLAAEPFLESEAPEIRDEAERALAGLSVPRARAERLVRHVHALVEKKPTVSLPSALEVLRTRVGDCNEHTALYVALARAAGLPARVAVGLVHLRGAFYYHAWPEVWVEERAGRGLWIPVDPTLNQFPADATHLRLARGGLEKQAAILALVGRARISILDLELHRDATPILVGRPASDLRPLALSLPRPGGGRRCWSSPAR